MSAQTIVGGEPARKKKGPPIPAQVENPLKNPMPNYAVYKMSTFEKGIAVVLAFAVGALCSQVFYGGLFRIDGRNTVLTYISTVVLIVFAGAAAIWIYLPMRSDQLRRKRQAALAAQFRDMLESITASLAAGDTVFNAFESALNDIKLQYGEDCDMARELEQVLLAPQSGIPMEDMLKDFAARSGNEDIESFSNVFSVCYSTGGNMRDVMRRTHDVITDKMAIADEIRTKLSANRLELNIITVAPVFLMLMLRFTNSSFAEKFASLGGVLCITIAVVIFVIAYKMGQKIVEIGGE